MEHQLQIALTEQIDAVASILTTGAVIVALIGLAMVAIPALNTVFLTRSERRDSRFATRF